MLGLPRRTQPMPPARHGRRRTCSRTVRAEVTRAVDFRDPGRHIDRVVESDAAGEAERQIAGLGYQRIEIPDVASLEIHAAGAVGTGVEPRADDASCSRAVAG